MGGGVERYHGLGPVDHRREHKLQLVLAERQRVAVLHLMLAAASNAIEASHHAKRLLVADNGDVGIILAHESQRTAVVGLHVVNNDIVDGTIADHIADVLYKLCEEIDLYGVYKTHLLVHDKIGVVRHSFGQWPQSLKEVLVAVVHTHIIDIACYLFHNV